MKGLTLRNYLTSKGFKLLKVAEALGESQQNFSASLAKDDVKTGLVERIAEATGIPLAELYGLSGGDVVGNGNIVNNGHDQFATDSNLVSVIKEQQSQMGRLISVIENLSKK